MYVTLETLDLWFNVRQCSSDSLGCLWILLDFVGMFVRCTTNVCYIGAIFIYFKKKYQNSCIEQCVFTINVVNSCFYFSMLEYQHFEPSEHQQEDNINEMQSATATKHVCEYCNKSLIIMTILFTFLSL